MRRLCHSSLIPPRIFEQVTIFVGLQLVTVAKILGEQCETAQCQSDDVWEDMKEMSQITFLLASLKV